MKKTVLLLLMAVGMHTSSYAQQIEILGTMFDIVLNDADMTAAIRNKDYRVDEDKFPMYAQKKKFANLTEGRVKTVMVPAKYTADDGREYTITTIGRAAFAGITNVDYFVIPNTITSIEDYAFFRSSVETIVIPASVTQMGNRVFGWCTKLRNLTLPLGMTVSPDLYSESRKITVKYELDANLVGAVAARNKTEEPSAYASTSDVDVDIPTMNASNTETFAVIIANENYKKVSKVPCAQNDGRTFRRYCENTLGIPAENIHEGEAKIIIYYAGHGIPHETDGAGYLLPVDVAGNDISAAYSLTNLYEALGKLNVRDITLFMDACFSGSKRGDGMLVAARGVAIKVKPENPLGKMVVFSAAQGNETAYPLREKEHGLFTYYLLEKLRDTKGEVSLGDLQDYVSTEVLRKSIVVNGKKQTPILSTSRGMGATWKQLKLK